MDKYETMTVVRKETKYALNEKEYWEIHDDIAEILKGLSYELHYNERVLDEHTKRVMMRCLMYAKRINGIIDC